MHFTKPAWVIHKDSSEKSDTPDAKRLSIFSVHVHPDGSRIATGGLDAKVRIWSTKPILSPRAEEAGRPPKSLSTLTMHTGPVLCVRWAHSGRWLASGSDDEIVMIWDLDPSARGKVWGSDEVNVEGWRPLKRLPGHESDVTDVAWAPDDRYLASVGLDSKVMIWCGFTLERLHKLDQHQGFVKGVCWDPVGEYLATQSDDRSVKIWRTTDWRLEAEVTKPFEDSPGSTFFRRLSWSPDGAHITASNATNNKGFVFIAAVITRNTWTSDISLVGHENTVEVAAYNPHIFLRNPDTPIATANICSVVALGADDRSVSVWQTKSARPLIVAKEVFERQIMDLNWSWDGLTLYAASSDGTLAVFHFDPEELEGIAPHSAQEQYLSKFGFIPPPLPEGYSHVPTTALPIKTTTPIPIPNTNPYPPSISMGEHVNQLVAKRNNKKRVGVPSANMNMMNGGMMEVEKRPQQQQQQQSFFPSPNEQPFADSGSWTRRDDLDMGMDVSMDMGEREREREEASVKPVFRTLGGDRPREYIPIREVSSSMMNAGSSSSMSLPVPAVVTRITTEVDGSDEVFETTYSEESGLVEVMYVSANGKTAWLDYLPCPALAIKATSVFCAVATQDGCVYVYSRSGRRVMPNLSLGSPCSVMDGVKSSLLVITSAGVVYSWAVDKQRAFFPPVSLASASLMGSVTSATARANGCPVLNCSDGVVYSYDPDLCAFVKLSERWWAGGSDSWQGRRGTAVSGRGIMAVVEGSLTGAGGAGEEGKVRPNWWGTALTLGHLETRMHGARMLDSPGEYRQALLLYAKKIADEGFRAKGEELIRELCGPVYWRPDDGETKWNPYVVGMAKRDLLKEVVLAQFAKSKTLTKLAIEWQDLLKKIVSEGVER